VSGPGNKDYSWQANRRPGTIASSLLGGIQASDREAWNRMCHLYAPLVYYWCRRQGLQSSDAEDVVQEVFRTVSARVAEFQRGPGASSFRGWLRTITRNKIGDLIREKRRRSDVDRAVREDQVGIDAIAARESVDDQAEISEETRLLYNRVLHFLRSQFAESTWQAFLRVVVDGAAPRDVAEELGLSLDSVYQAKSRVLRRVRDELGELDR
jgi:RNA polymerase sigma-70 factor (ECF subfamily)